MVWSGRAGWRKHAWGLAIALVVAGCSDDPVGPDADPGPLVGDWEATSLVVTNVANPTQAPDLIALGATFTLNVQPSGQYTAILVFAQQSSTEIGTLHVSGSSVTLRPSFPPGQPATTGTFSIQGDLMTLDGATEFDFNLDGTPEPAAAHFEFRRR